MQEAPTGAAPLPATPRRLRELSPRERRILLALVLAGALLRCAYHWGRPLTGDEVGTLIYLRADYGVLLTEFRTWLTMNFYQVALKAFASVLGQSPWVLVLPSLLPGIALVPLVAAITLRLSTVRHALLAAALVAYNPFLVLYAVQVRSYMLYTWLALLTLLLLLDWQREPRWKSGWRAALASGAAFLVHPNGGYAALALALFVARRRRLDLPRSWSRSALRELATLFVPWGLALGAVALAYVPLLADMAAIQAELSDAPPTALTYLPETCKWYFGGGYASLVTLLLLGAGLWRAAEENRALLDTCLLVVVPLALTSLLGISVYPWAYARYHVWILPILIVWIAFGCRHSASRVASFVLACVPFVAWAPAHLRLHEEKRDYPWMELVEHLTAEVGERDAILTVGTSIEQNLTGRQREYEPHFVTAEKLVELGRKAPTPVTLRVLTDEPHLDGPESHAFGRLQELVYRGQSGAEVALALARDLDEVTAGRVEADLTFHYRLAFEIYAALGRPEAHGAQVKYLKCQSRLHRETMRPPQMP